MSMFRSARFPWTLAAFYAAAAAGCWAFGAWGSALAFGALAIGMAVWGLVNHIKHKKHEGQSNGRYRKAAEAHRVGAGRGAGDRTGDGARRGTGRTGAGAGMNRAERHQVEYLLRTGRYTDAIIAGAVGVDEHDVRSLRAQLGVSRLVAASSPAPSLLSPLPTLAAVQTQTPQVSEFDGKEAAFAAGVVTGTRSFDVDDMGRLLGVTFRAVWTPGENEAKCMRRNDEYYQMLSYGQRPTGPAVHESPRPAHSLADCGHGFYGYYEGSNDFYTSGRVMGVVEGYGEAVIGTRGFRVSKARIVALHIPTDVAIGKRNLIIRNYPEIPVFDSFDAMIAEFPPDDAGEGISPATDPDFWTRSVR